MEFYSPQIAKDWVDLYAVAINEHMQKRQVAKVARNIGYLEAQIEKTAIAEMREVFYKLIEEQIKNKMIAEASPDYVFIPVSTSMVPEEKSAPNRFLFFGIGTLLGFFLACVFMIARGFVFNLKP